MNRFCTLFDSYYLTRGLSLYRSLEKVHDERREDFELVIFCMDEKSHELLTSLGLSRARLVPLSEFENERLLAVKGQRNVGEYCWTCTPFSILYCLEHFSFERVTYLDADLYFFQSPSLLLDELDRQRKSVLITAHRFSKDHAHNSVAGIYCVQFVTFDSKPESLKLLHHWANQCIDWCYDRIEPYRYGDQKYLDPWPELYSFVHVLEHLGGGIGPWNVTDYHLTRAENQSPMVNDVPVVFYHFHQLRWFRKPAMFDLVKGHYRISKVAQELIYHPYLVALKSALGEIQLIDPTFDLGKVDAPKGIPLLMGRMSEFLQGTLRNVPEPGNSAT